jgi:GDP-L-fucose synthase
LFFKDKEVLITGGTGLVGRQLTDLLLEQQAKITIVSLDKVNDKKDNIKYIYKDLRYFENCLEVCKNKEIVFHLAGIKGSPLMAKEKPASFLYPTITFSLNMMEAARKMSVSRYLFTSSVGVYSPAEKFHEDDVWKTFPSKNDWYAGWAKRICELQAESYKIEYGWDKISIVRPANIYGPYDNFDPQNAMVIPSLINRALKENPLICWGDGSPIRDFIFSKDVALGMMKVVEDSISEPINLGSGSGISIKKLVSIIVKSLPHQVDLEWDKTKPNGDKIRIMDTKKAQSYGISVKTSIEDGIKQTIDWYIENKDEYKNRFNVFLEN